MTDHDEELDATGLLCPLPVLKAARRLRGMAPGEVLLMRSDDPAAVVDVPHYCVESGNALLDSREEGAVTLWWLRRT